jgi:hypothetical protein
LAVGEAGCVFSFLEGDGPEVGRRNVYRQIDAVVVVAGEGIIAVDKTDSVFGAFPGSAKNKIVVSPSSRKFN